MYRLTTSFNSGASVDNTKSNGYIRSILYVNDAFFLPNSDREQTFNPNMSFKICKSRVSFVGLKGLREGINGIPCQNPQENEYRAAKILFTGSAGFFLNQHERVPTILEIKKYNEWENQDIIIPAKSYSEYPNLYPDYKLNIKEIHLSYDGIGIQTIYNGRSIIPFVELLIDDTKLRFA